LLAHFYMTFTLLRRVEWHVILLCLCAHFTTALRIADPFDEPDFEEVAKQGRKHLQAATCEDLPGAMSNAIDDVKASVELLCQGPVLECRLEPVTSDYQKGLQAVNNASLLFSLITTFADEKQCLRKVMKNTTVASKLKDLDQFIQPVREHEGRLKDTTRNFSLWQNELADLGDTLMDQAQLFPTEVSAVDNCPSPCWGCTREHNSWWQGKERFKFKCFLSSWDRNNPPSNSDTRIQCDKPRRRFFRFLSYKTWCKVPDWTALAYEKAKVGAIVSCGAASLWSTLIRGMEMSEEVYRTCMLVGQRMAVNSRDLGQYEDFTKMLPESDVSEGVLAVGRVLLVLSTTQGLSGLRASSEGNVPPEDFNLGKYVSGYYTFLDPSMVKDIPCDPPVVRNTVLMGLFAIIALTVLSPLAALGSILFQTGWILVSALFLWLLGWLYNLVGWWVIFLPHTWLTLVVVPGTVHDIIAGFADNLLGMYRRIMGAEETFCPRGMLFKQSKQPLCIRGMDDGASKSYQCPDNKDKSFTVSCEKKFEGYLVIRNPC
jgi:hypothetical protein